MNSRSKNTGTRKSPVRTKKPATIDLEAKEVESAKAEAKSTTSASTSTARAAASTSSKPSPQNTGKAPEKPLGRAGAKTTDSGEKTKTTDTKSASSAAPSPDSKTPPPEKRTNNGLGSGIMGGVFGAVLAALGLGALGQMEGASNLPLIGSLYAQGNAQSDSDVVKRLEAELADLKTRTSEIDLSSLNARLATLENGPGSALPQDLGVRIADSENRLGELQEIVESLSQTTGQTQGDGQDNNIKLREATEKLASIENRLNELSSSTKTDLSPIQAEIASLSAKIDQIRIDVSDNSTTLASIQKQSSSLQQTVESVKASEKVARSVAVNALGAALENDDPITLAIASIESLGGQTSETRRLAEISKAGIPSRAALIADLATITQGVQNPTSATKGGTISERFWANARNLVSFRSSGPQPGNSPIAILSRVKAEIENGNLASARTEWEKLPSEIRLVETEWLNTLETRIEAFTLFESLSSKLSAEAG